MVGADGNFDWKLEGLEEMASLLRIAMELQAMLGVFGTSWLPYGLLLAMLSTRVQWGASTSEIGVYVSDRCWIGISVNCHGYLNLQCVALQLMLLTSQQAAAGAIIEVSILSHTHSSSYMSI